ncbi:hypothetical protein AGDE_03897 [Angomonas deanei]|nr:hypothetical protein AGDE_03897 [Angomonas deanei]|eukprot:EPY40031.1 hypothetical protein AGDE_03897 [Angomonas deanei]
MYAFNLNDYSEKTVSSMECERSGNPLVDVYVAIRVIQLFQSIMIPSYIMLGCYSLLFAYTLFRMKRGKLYVDATNLWRDAKYFERESYILIAMDVVTIVICLIAMIFSFVNYYTD